MAEACLHCYVTGRVQGVFFRANTQKQAQRLGLTGWVKNMDDGRVEVMANGEQLQLAELKKWLAKGPLGARVKKLDSETLAPQTFNEFQIKY